MRGNCKTFLGMSEALKPRAAREPEKDSRNFFPDGKFLEKSIDEIRSLWYNDSVDIGVSSWRGRRRRKAHRFTAKIRAPGAA
jgi:hypothetical protein